MKNFVEQISIKFEGLLNPGEFGANCAVDEHTKIEVEIRISVDFRKVKYRWTDISIGGQSISTTNCLDSSSGSCFSENIEF